MKSPCDISATNLRWHEIITTSQISYLQDKKVTIDGEQCLIDTGFRIDHTEPKAALAALKVEWKLGELPFGHEFLAIAFIG